MTPEEALAEQKEITEYQIKEVGLYPTKYKHLSERYQVIYNNLRKFFTDETLKNSKFLDMGCRSGEFLERLKSTVGTQENLYGIDICKNAIDIAINDREVKNCIVGDIHKTKYEDNFFDIIVASHVVEHSYDVELLKKEIHRILKPSGRAFIILPVEGEPEPGYTKVETEGMNDGHYHHWPLPAIFVREWNDYFESALIEITLTNPAEDGSVRCSQAIFYMKPRNKEGKPK